MGKNIVVVDIDGTLSRPGERLKYIKQEPKDWDAFYNDCFDDEPVGNIISLVHCIAQRYAIVFCTGRRSSVRDKTVAWLEKHLSISFLIPEYSLLMRPANDTRHDTDVKPELLEVAGYSPDKVAFILEDRSSMCKKWRELGYTCLQVADGDF
jgi:hypothetical protein